MKPAYKPIIAAISFSALLIASTYFLKKNPMQDWVNAVIYGAGIYFWFWYFMVSDRSCSSKIRDGRGIS